MFHWSGNDPEQIILHAEWYTMIVCPACRNNPAKHCLICDEVGSVGFRTPLCPTDLDIPWTINERYYEILLEQDSKDEDTTDKGFFHWLLNYLHFNHL